MIAYAARQRREGLPLARITRHLLGLFARQSGTRAWKRYLSESACRPGAGAEVLRQAMGRVSDEVLDFRPNILTY